MADRGIDSARVRRYDLYNLIYNVFDEEEAMGAIAVSKEDEGQIGELMRELGVKSKSHVVRVALRTLRERLDQEKLRTQIRESVQRCAEADRRENRLLAPGAVPRDE
jgi:Arc/MetJ-type ribon-helix-helix transcriptional regulator